MREGQLSPRSSYTLQIHMKKSICFVATTPFAVNAFLRTHLLAFAEHYDVVLCVNTGAYPLSEDLATGIHVIHVDIARKIAPLADSRALFQLFKVFLRNRPDVVHSITPKAGLLAMLAAWLAGVPHRFHTFTGQVWASRAGLGRTILKALDRLIVMLASRVFADSRSQCRYLEAESLVRPNGISILGQGSIAGVNLARFHPNPLIRNEVRSGLGVTDNTAVFLFVGRLASDKGVFDLIASFDQVASNHEDCELWVVGPDEESLLVQLKFEAAKGRGSVRWFGPTMEPERYMVAADVFVLPSYREGFGSVVIEAAACGLPTIAYRIEGIVDAVVENETGLLVTKLDRTALAGAMTRLAADIEFRRQLGEAAMERAKRRFSGESVTAAWMDFYGQLLGRIHGGQI